MSSITASLNTLLLHGVLAFTLPLLITKKVPKLADLL